VPIGLCLLGSALVRRGNAKVGILFTPDGFALIYLEVNGLGNISPDVTVRRMESAATEIEEGAVDLMSSRAPAQSGRGFQHQRGKPCVRQTAPIPAAPPPAITISTSVDMFSLAMPAHARAGNSQHGGKPPKLAPRHCRSPVFAAYRTQIHRLSSSSIGLHNRHN